MLPLILLIHRNVAEKKVFSRACKSRQFAIVAGFIESRAKISNSSRPGGRLSSGVNSGTYKIAH